MEIPMDTIAAFINFKISFRLNLIPKIKGNRKMVGIQKIDSRWVPIIKNKLAKNQLIFFERKKYREIR